MKFQKAEELSKAIDAYFEECDRVEDTRMFGHGEKFIWTTPKWAIKRGGDRSSYSDLVLVGRPRGRSVDSRPSCLATASVQLAEP